MTEPITIDAILDIDQRGAVREIEKLSRVTPTIDFKVNTGFLKAQIQDSAKGIRVNLGADILGVKADFKAVFKEAGQSLGEEFKGALQNIKLDVKGGGILGGLLSAVTFPLTSIVNGLTTGLGVNLVSGLGKNIVKGLEGELSPLIGSFELISKEVGKTLGQELLLSYGKSLESIQKITKSVIGEQFFNIEVGAVKFENEQNAVEKINKATAQFSKEAKIASSPSVKAAIQNLESLITEFDTLSKDLQLKINKALEQGGINQITQEIEDLNIKLQQSSKALLVIEKIPLGQRTQDQILQYEKLTKEIEIYSSKIKGSIAIATVLGETVNNSFQKEISVISSLSDEIGLLDFQIKEILSVADRLEGIQDQGKITRPSIQNQNQAYESSIDLIEKLNRIQEDFSKRQKIEQNVSIAKELFNAELKLKLAQEARFNAIRELSKQETGFIERESTGVQKLIELIQQVSQSSLKTPISAGLLAGDYAGVFSSGSSSINVSDTQIAIDPLVFKALNGEISSALDTEILDAVMGIAQKIRQSITISDEFTGELLKASEQELRRVNPLITEEISKQNAVGNELLQAQIEDSIIFAYRQAGDLAKSLGVISSKTNTDFLKRGISGEITRQLEQVDLIFEEVIKASGDQILRLEQEFPKIVRAGSTQIIDFLLKGTQAAYNNLTNEIILNPKLFDKIQNEDILSRSELSFLIHEIRHSLQLAFGNIDINSDSFAVELQEISKEALSILGKGLKGSIESAVNQGVPKDVAKKLEEDAYEFQVKYTNQIFRNITSQLNSAVQKIALTPITVDDIQSQLKQTRVTTESEKWKSVSEEVEQNLFNLYQKTIQQIEEITQVRFTKIPELILTKHPDFNSIATGNQDTITLNYDQVYNEYGKLHHKILELFLHELRHSLQDQLGLLSNQDAVGLQSLENSDFILKALQGELNKISFSTGNTLKDNILASVQGSLNSFVKQAEILSPQSLESPQFKELTRIITKINSIIERDANLFAIRNLESVANNLETELKALNIDPGIYSQPVSVKTDAVQKIINESFDSVRETPEALQRAFSEIVKEMSKMTGVTLDIDPQLIIGKVKEGLNFTGTSIDNQTVLLNENIIHDLQSLKDNIFVVVHEAYHLLQKQLTDAIKDPSEQLKVLQSSSLHLEGSQKELEYIIKNLNLSIEQATERSVQLAIERVKESLKRQGLSEEDINKQVDIYRQLSKEKELGANVFAVRNQDQLLSLLDETTSQLAIRQPNAVEKVGGIVENKLSQLSHAVESQVVALFNNALRSIPNDPNTIDINARQITSLSEIDAGIVKELALKGSQETLVNVVSGVKTTFNVLQGIERAVLSLDPTGAAKLATNIAKPLVLFAAASQVPGVGMLAGEMTQVVASAISPLTGALGAEAATALTGAISHVLSGVPFSSGIEAALTQNITHLITAAAEGGTEAIAAALTAITTGQAIRGGTEALVNKALPEANQQMALQAGKRAERASSQLIEVTAEKLQETADLFQKTSQAISVSRLPASKSVFPSLLPQIPDTKALRGFLESNINQKGLANIYQQLTGVSGSKIKRQALIGEIEAKFAENDKPVKQAIAQIESSGLKANAEFQALGKPNLDESLIISETEDLLKKSKTALTLYQNLADQYQNQGLEQLKQVGVLVDTQLQAIQEIKSKFDVSGDTSTRLSNFKKSLEAQSRRIQDQIQVVETRIESIPKLPDLPDVASFLPAPDPKKAVVPKPPQLPPFPIEQIRKAQEKMVQDIISPTVKPILETPELNRVESVIEEFNQFNQRINEGLERSQKVLELAQKHIERENRRKIIQASAKPMPSLPSVPVNINPINTESSPNAFINQRYNTQSINQINSQVEGINQARRRLLEDIEKELNELRHIVDLDGVNSDEDINRIRQEVLETEQLLLNYRQKIEQQIIQANRVFADASLVSERATLHQSNFNEVVRNINVNAEVSSVQARQELERLGQSINSTEERSRSLKDTFRVLINQLEERIPQPIKSLFPLLKSFRVAMAGFLAYQVLDPINWWFNLRFAIQSLVTQVEKLEAAKIKIESFGGSLESALITADKYKISLDTVVQGYAQLTAATKGTNLEGIKTQRILDSVAQSSRVFGLSAEDTTGFLLAMRQILSGSTLQLQELNQISERLPGALSLSAKAMRVTTGELRDLTSAAAVSSEEFAVNFAEQLKIISQTGLPASLKSIQSERTQMVNEARKLQFAVGKEFQSGILFGIEVLTGLAKAGQVAAKGISVVLPPLAVLTAAFTAFKLPSLILATSNALNILSANSAVSAVLNALSSGFASASAATRSFITAQIALQPLVVSATASQGLHATALWSSNLAIKANTDATVLNALAAKGANLVLKAQILLENLLNTAIATKTKTLILDTVAQRGRNLVMLAGVGVTKLATLAIKGFNLAIAVSPVILLIGAVKLLTDVFGNYREEVNRTNENLKAYQEQLRKASEFKSQTFNLKAKVEINREEFQKDLNFFSKEINKPFGRLMQGVVTSLVRIPIELISAPFKLAFNSITTLIQAGVSLFTGGIGKAINTYFDGVKKAWSDIIGIVRNPSKDLQNIFAKDNEGFFTNRAIIAQSDAFLKAQESATDYYNFLQKLKNNEPVDPEQITQYISALEFRNEQLRNEKGLKDFQIAQNEAEIKQNDVVIKQLKEKKDALEGTKIRYAEVAEARKKASEAAKKAEADALYEIEKLTEEGAITSEESAIKKQQIAVQAAEAELKAQRDAQEKIKEAIEARLRYEERKRTGNLAGEINLSPEVVQAIKEGNIAKLKELRVDPKLIEDIEKAQTEITELEEKATLDRIKLAQMEKEEKERIAKKAQDDAVKAVEEEYSKVNDEIEQKEQERIIAIKRLRLSGGLNESQADKALENATKERLEAELKAEEDNIRKIEQLQIESGLSEEDRKEAIADKEKQLSEARKRYGEIQINLLDNQIEKETELKETIENITQAIEENKKAALDHQQLDLLEQAINRSKELSQLRFDLATAQNNLLTGQSDIEIQKLERAKEILKELRTNDELTSGQQKALRQELVDLGINGRTSELKLTRQINQIEEENRQRKFDALQREFNFKQQQLDIERQIAEIQARKEVLSAKNNLNQLRQSRLDAERQIREDEKAVKEAKTPQEKEAAQRRVELSKEQLNIVDEQIKLGLESLDANNKQIEDLKEINRLKQEQLDIEREIALRQEGFNNLRDRAIDRNENATALSETRRGEIDKINRDATKKLIEAQRERDKASQQGRQDAQKTYEDAKTQIEEEQKKAIAEINQQFNRQRTQLNKLPTPAPYFDFNQIYRQLPSIQVVPQQQSQSNQQIIKELQLTRAELKRIQRPEINQEVTINAETRDVDAIVRKAGNATMDGILSGLSKIGL